jgi:hypothetical protein
MADQWRDLTEAAIWLEAETGKPWTARDVLRKVIATTPAGGRPMPEGAVLPIVFSPGAAAIDGELHPKEEQDGPRFITKRTLLNLSVERAEDLLIADATGIFVARVYRSNKRASFVPFIDLRLGDLRVNEETLRALVGDPAALNGSPKPKPIPRQLWQESRIREAMQELGISLESLPAVKNGNRGVAADIRDLLRSRDGIERWSDAIFEKAWKRVRTN